MPNHVKNIIKMEGIYELPIFKEEDGVQSFDFNKIIPMPESLDIEKGSITDESIIYYLTERHTIPISCLDAEKTELLKKADRMFRMKELGWAEDVFLRGMKLAYGKSEGERDKMYAAGKVYVTNLQKYGATTWYDWCCDNWDTKWNAYANERIDEDTIAFQTAWSCPEKIITKLSKMYPDKVIEHWWADEEPGANSGYVKYKTGVVIEGGGYDDFSSAACETYVFCWGESNCLYQDNDGYWHHRDCETCSGCD